MRHLLNITDLTVDEIKLVLELSQRDPASLGRPLAESDGTPKGAALIFEKPSNRTRHSMEIAVVQLGGQSRAQRADQHFLRQAVAVVARLRAVRGAAVAPQRAADRTHTGAAGALLLPQLLARTGRFVPALCHSRSAADSRPVIVHNFI